MHSEAPSGLPRAATATGRMATATWLRVVLLCVPAALGLLDLLVETPYGDVRYCALPSTVLLGAGVFLAMRDNRRRECSGRGRGVHVAALGVSCVGVLCWWRHTAWVVLQRLYFCIY
jgi:hypothetical protein